MIGIHGRHAATTLPFSDASLEGKMMAGNRKVGANNERNDVRCAAAEDG